MAETGVAVFCGLPQEINFRELDAVFARGVLELEPNSATVLAAAFNSQDEVMTWYIF